MRADGTTVQGLFSYVLNAFATHTLVGDPGGQFYSWDFDPTGSTLYAIQTPASGSSLFGTVNTTTGAFTQIAAVTGLTSGDTPTGLSIDPVTGAAFVSSANGLYTFNLATGAATAVGTFGISAGIMIDIAINCDGELYGHDIGTDSLYRIDRATGAPTLVGPHGLAANFAQGMDFDNNDGSLYAAIYTGGGTYTYGTFNLATGAVTPLSTNTPSGEWELAIPTTCGPVVPPSEVEPNDSKAQANTLQLPGTNRTGVMTGTSISATGEGIDTFLVKATAQAPGFYRHRLLVTSTTPGHTISIRGLTQSAGVIAATSDTAVQTGVTTPARYVQWYTNGTASDLYVRVTGTATTTAPYQLDYEVEPVTPIIGPTGVSPGSVTITSVGQTTVDTDLWLYNGARAAIVDAGNDDTTASVSQSTLTRTLDPGVYYVAVSNWNVANNLASPADDAYRSGPVVDFPGVVVGSSTSTTVTDVDLTIGGTAVTVARNGVFDVKFVRFSVGVYEVEPNDNKAQANAVVLPAVNGTNVVSGNTTAATGAGLDYFRVTTAAQSTPGFYRHRLLVVSDTVGHALTLRGLTQATGVINATSDAEVQAASATTTPARFIQWYTSEVPADVYVRVGGGAATTADYRLDYEVTPVTEIAGPDTAGGELTVTTVGQTTTDTDLWIYNGARSAVPDYGNDDITGGSQSRLVRTYAAGTYYVAVSNWNLANNLGSPADDSYRSGNVLDFPGAIVNSSTTANLSVNTSIAGTAVPATRAGPYDVVFIRFTAADADTIFRNGFD
ncbi:hypothetical protein ACQQ2N_01715 [Dokdonella sp. MW10]|uniref:hypothetical protein n=1 Tax=Dokdonella sp. MW10 TaxID=2992926 RepID=UPI003F80971B